MVSSCSAHASKRARLLERRVKLEQNVNRSDSKCKGSVSLCTAPPDRRRQGAPGDRCPGSITSGLGQVERLLRDLAGALAVTLEEVDLGPHSPGVGQDVAGASTSFAQRYGPLQTDLRRPRLPEPEVRFSEVGSIATRAHFSGLSTTEPEVRFSEVGSGDGEPTVADAFLSPGRSWPARRAARPGDSLERRCSPRPGARARPALCGSTGRRPRRLRRLRLIGAGAGGLKQFQRLPGVAGNGAKCRQLRLCAGPLERRQQDAPKAVFFHRPGERLDRLDQRA